MQRRDLLALTGYWLMAGFGITGGARATAPPVIRMISDPAGANVGYQPVGLFVEPGETVRWVVESGVHTVTAYHPTNGFRPLRIPEEADAWDSGYLMKPGALFEKRFDVPGVYDYFCAPHEHAGMVGRLVVGQVSGPGAPGFGELEPGASAVGRLSVPDVARANFPDAQQIMRDGVVYGRRAGDS